MHNCCACQTGPTPPPCRTVITSADLAELIYIAGLDEDLCEKFQLLTEIFQLTDCAGNLIAGSTEIVTCADFADQLCAAIADLVSAGDLVLEVTEVVGADCQTYTVPETLIAVVDTPSVNLTSSGPFGHTLQADVIISPDAGNATVILPNGVYTPDLCTAAADADPGAPVVFDVTELLGADCLTHTVTETPITVVDSNSVDLTSSGPFGHTIEADVNLSANPGNQIVELVDGLFVPAGTDVNIAVLDTACLDLSIVEAPAGTFLISGAPVISPNPGNNISCVGNGLFVPVAAAVNPTVIQAVDNGCIELDAVEAPADTWTITPTLVISPNAGNVAECLGNGLYVPEGTFILDCAEVVATFTEDPGPIPPGTTFLADDCNTYPLPAQSEVTALDTNTINTTVTPVGDDFQVSAVAIISPDYPGFPPGCNTLVATVDGLAALPEHTGLNFEVGDITHSTGAMLEGAIRIFADVVVMVTNPSACRSMAITILSRMPEVYHEQIVLQRARTHIRIDHEFAFPTATPPVVFGPVIKSEWFLASDAPEIGDTAIQMIGNGNPGTMIANLIILPPGASGTYTMTGVIVQELGPTSSVNSAGLLVRITGQTI